ncbi:TonB-dependent receptor [Azorhizobium oxalatiphilum]|uniref:TonB-dependent receptor n=1 Tax=Azorhizobium oxalatiphilum TaxID=980631 RepID=A0A917BUP2_9HYPH|nr:TonB-dependent receptor [Azorhizobium oxalatiphilum]GGF55096.1 TonB-dependent receptor [Azorhizobium oxalatiphilum]
MAAVSRFLVSVGMLAPLVSLASAAPAQAQSRSNAADATAMELPAVNVTTASPIGGDGAAAAFWNYGSFSFVNDAFAPVTVAGQRQIELSPAATLADVLFTQPGITSSTFAPGASRPVIRGLESVRVKMAENGIDAMDVSALGEDHAVPIDPMSAQRIEVIRGPATLRYGSQAIGGVVNAENNRIPTELTKDGYKGSMQGAGTVVDDGIDGSVSVDARQGAWAVHADAFGRSFGDYSIPGGGKEANTYVRSNGQAVGLTYNFDGGYVGSALTRFASTYGIPGGEEAELQTNIDMEQLKWLSKGEYRFASGPVESVRFWTGLSKYEHSERGLEHEHDHEEGEEESAADILAANQQVTHGSFKSKAFEGRVEIAHVPVGTPIGLMRGALGFQFNYTDLDTTGEMYEFLAPTRTTSAASYLFEEFTLAPSTRVQMAGRIEGVKVNGAAGDIPANYLPPPEELTTTGAERTFVPVSVSVGLLQDMAWGMTGRLTAQYVERAPTAPELYAKGAHDATGTFDLGNPDLQKEGASSIEIGLSRTVGPVRFDASAYYTRFNGFIYKQLTGITCGEDFASCGAADGEFDQVAYDQRNATFYGVELKAQYDVGALWGGVWGVEGQYDFVHATFSDGSYVPRMPPHRLGGGLYWGDGAFAARVNLLHAFGQDQVAAFEDTTPGYNLLNAELSYTRKVGDYGLNPVMLTVGLTGTNLLDEDIQNSASFKSDVLLPGRNLRGFAKVTF